MMISAVRIQKKNPSRLNVYLDGEMGFSIAREVAVAEAIEVGAELPESRVAALQEMDELWRARERALTLLERRAQSTAELRRKLTQRRFGENAVERCIAALTAAGLLNDEVYARAFVEQRLRTRPKSATALIGDLLRRGIDLDLARRAVSDATDAGALDEIELARRVLPRFRARARESATATRRRLYAFLARRGFSAETIARVVDEAGIGTDE